MVDLQLLNYILSTKDYSIVTDNNLDNTYFDKYKNEFNFIDNHFKQYGVVPDKATCLSSSVFKNFEFLNVGESKEYLLDALDEEKVYSDARKIIEECGQVLAQQDSRKGVSDLIEKLSELKLTRNNKLVDLVGDAEKRYNEYVERSSNLKNIYVTTGLKEIDDILGGWSTLEDMAVIAARPGVGKTWWLIYFLWAAVTQGKRVGLFSGEMSDIQIGYRLDTIISHISNFRISRGFTDVKDDYRSHIDRLKKEANKHLFIVTPNDFDGRVTVSKLKNWCKQNNIEILGVDQYSLLDDERGARESFNRFANISTDIKRMQTELRIPILINAQLGRSATAKDVEDAGTEHLAGSDKISQDASTVLTIERKEHGVVIRIAKAREAKTGSKLNYQWDVDKGILQYIPSENDATDGKYTNELKESFQDKKEDVF